MLLKKSIAVGLAALGMGVAGLGLSAPAFANSAAAADITTPLRATDGAKAGGVAPGGDEEFSKLFASWEALDGGSAGTSSQAPLVRSATVSIPTLVPVLSSRAMSSGFGLRTHPIYGGLRAHKGSTFPRRRAPRSALPPMAWSARLNASAAMACSSNSNMAATSKPAMAT
jgi:murein DD-endopeptidase MepM/ murein hydrolase activator NlpD